MSFHTQVRNILKFQNQFFIFRFFIVEVGKVIYLGFQPLAE